MDIRECQEGDLEILERHIASPGQTHRHAMRFETQQQGLSTFLVAWSDGIPVGTAQTLWHGCKAPEAQDVRESSTTLRGMTRPGAIALGILNAEHPNSPRRSSPRLSGPRLRPWRGPGRERI